MKISASIELIMQFATYEAIAGKFKEVEPEHMLMALLRFPELSVDELEKLAPGAATVKQVVKEIDAVCKELSHRAIESKKIRRELRAKMGNGNSPFSGGRVHRSTAGREIFDIAGKLADDGGSEAITAEHILEALITTPTKLIKEVFGDALGPKMKERKDTPFLDKYGRDLTKMAVDGDLYPGNDQMAEGKALVNVLSQPDCKSVLLITDNEPLAMQTVIRAVQTLVKKDDCPKTMRCKKIFDVTSLNQSGEWDRQKMDQFVRLFAEAASVEDVILFVPPMESLADGRAVDDWAVLLRKTLVKGSVQCICQVKTKTYKNCIKRDSSWKRLANIIWLHDDIKDEIPSEL